MNGKMMSEQDLEMALYNQEVMESAGLDEDLANAPVIPCEETDESLILGARPFFQPSDGAPEHVLDRLAEVSGFMGEAVSSPLRLVPGRLIEAGIVSPFVVTVANEMGQSGEDVVRLRPHLLGRDLFFSRSAGGWYEVSCL